MSAVVQVATKNNVFSYWWEGGKHYIQWITNNFKEEVFSI